MVPSFATCQSPSAIEATFVASRGCRAHLWSQVVSPTWNNRFTCAAPFPPAPKMSPDGGSLMDPKFNVFGATGNDAGLVTLDEGWPAGGAPQASASRASPTVRSRPRFSVRPEVFQIITRPPHQRIAAI